MTKEKLCFRCKETKPLEKFTKDKLQTENKTLKGLLDKRRLEFILGKLIYEIHLSKDSDNEDISRAVKEILSTPKTKKETSE